MKMDHPQFAFTLSMQQSESSVKLIVQVVLWTFLKMKKVWVYSSKLNTMMKGYSERLLEVSMLLLKCSERLLMHCMWFTVYGVFKWKGGLWHLQANQ